jgi:hypothetical protein
MSNTTLGRNSELAVARNITSLSDLSAPCGQGSQLELDPVNASKLFLVLTAVDKHEISTYQCILCNRINITRENLRNHCEKPTHRKLLVSAPFLTEIASRRWECKVCFQVIQDIHLKNHCEKQRHQDRLMRVKIGSNQERNSSRIRVIGQEALTYEVGEVESLMRGSGKQSIEPMCPPSDLLPFIYSKRDETAAPSPQSVSAASPPPASTSSNQTAAGAQMTPANEPILTSLNLVAIHFTLNRSQQPPPFPSHDCADAKDETKRIDNE